MKRGCPEWQSPRFFGPLRRAPEASELELASQMGTPDLIGLAHARIMIVMILIIILLLLIIIIVMIILLIIVIIMIMLILIIVTTITLIIRILILILIRFVSGQPGVFQTLPPPHPLP